MFYPKQHLTRTKFRLIKDILVRFNVSNFIVIVIIILQYEIVHFIIL